MSNDFGFMQFLSSVASRRSSEELIFEGRVTVNGSVCNTPQVTSQFHVFLAVFLFIYYDWCIFGFWAGTCCP